MFTGQGRTVEAMSDKTVTSDNKEFNTAKNKIIIAVICFAFIVI